MNDKDFDLDFNIDDFDLDAVVSPKFKTRIFKPSISKEVKEHQLSFDNAIKLSKEIDISENERYFVIINGTFYFGDFIEALITTKLIHVKKMVISTLSLNENNVDSFANLLNGEYVDSLDLIVSYYFYSHERQNLVKYLYNELDKENRFQLAAARTHCKVCIFETHEGAKVVIHGSSNLRSSGNIEQIVIEENKFLYDFNYKYQQGIIKEFKTINKSVSSKQAWEIIKS